MSIRSVSSLDDEELQFYKRKYEQDIKSLAVGPLLDMTKQILVMINDELDIRGLK